jgi:hypothetical protein
MLNSPWFIGCAARFYRAGQAPAMPRTGGQGDLASLNEERYFFPEPLLQFQRHWESAKVSAIRLRRRGNTMKNPLDSLWGTIICGVLLTAVLYFVVKGILT